MKKDEKSSQCPFILKLQKKKHEILDEDHLFVNEVVSDEDTPKPCYLSIYYHIYLVGFWYWMMNENWMMFDDSLFEWISQ